MGGTPFRKSIAHSGDALPAALSKKCTGHDPASLFRTMPSAGKDDGQPRKTGKVYDGFTPLEKGKRARVWYFQGFPKNEIRPVRLS
jgi:hypothetical protein